MPFGRPILQGRPMVSAGRRDKLVTIRVKSDVTRDSGFPAEDPTVLRDEYMSRLDLRGNEDFRTNQTSAFTETQWHGPYSEDMDPELVDVPKVRDLVFQGRVYDILSASCFDRRIGIEYMTLAKQG